MRRFVALLVTLVATASLASGAAKRGGKGDGQGLGPGRQQWDFLELRDGAFMFYWMYFTHAPVEPETRPLVFWLQGGPGASSTGYGNFEELGVLDVYLNERNTTWVKEVNVVFVDNPVGTGFSYVENRNLLTTNNAEIAADLVTFTELFLRNNEGFRATPLYIFSESYGGKMAAEFALELDKAVRAGRFQANLQGVALGDGWLSPIDSVITWAPYLLHTGVVDYDGYEKVDASAKSTQSAVNSGLWSLATSLWGQTEGVIMRVTHNVDFYNILEKIPDYGLFIKEENLGLRMYRRHLSRDDAALYRLMNGKVREALGIDDSIEWDSQSGWVWNALTGDFMKPATDAVERVLNETDVRVVVFSGQLDLIVDTPGTLDWVMRLKWPGAQSWRSASRGTLAVDGYIEGYIKKEGNFAFYWIDRAGHMVPSDNPYAGLEMLRQVTKFDQ